MFKHILLPSDGSDSSSQAAKVAVELAQKLGARITGLHVMQPQNIVMPDLAGGYTYLMPDEMYERAVKAQAERLLGELSSLAQEAKVPCETISLTGGSPWQSIIDTARDRGCDAIVMASHGRKGISAVLLGSETAKVLTHCSLPVLVTR